MKWERVEKDIDLWRVDVPGGWLYQAVGDKGARTVTFVPRPVDRVGESTERLVVALRASRELVLRLQENTRASGACSACGIKPCSSACPVRVADRAISEARELTEVFA